MHVHLVRAEQPLQLQTIGGGCNQRGSIIGIDVRRYGSGSLTGTDPFGQIGPNSAETRVDEVPCGRMMALLQRICGQRRVQLNQTRDCAVTFGALFHHGHGRDVGRVGRLMNHAFVFSVNRDQELITRCKVVSQRGMRNADGSSNRAQRRASSLFGEQFDSAQENLGSSFGGFPI